MSKIVTADTTNETASARIANGALTNCTSAPANPGPPISASDEPDQQHACARDDHKYRQLPRAGTEDQQRDERHRGPRDDRTELGHGLTRPELDEILVLPKRSRYHGDRSVPPRGEVVLAAGP